MRAHIREKKSRLQGGSGYFPEPGYIWQPGLIPQMPLCVFKDQTQGSIWSTGTLQVLNLGKHRKWGSCWGGELLWDCSASEGGKGRASLLCEELAHLWSLNTWQKTIIPWERITYNPATPLLAWRNPQTHAQILFQKFVEDLSNWMNVYCSTNVIVKNQKQPKCPTMGEFRNNNL